MNSRPRARIWQLGAVLAAILLAGAAGIYWTARDVGPTHPTSKPSLNSLPATVKASVTVPHTLNRAGDPQLAAVIDRVNPANDAGWETEVLADAAKQRLTQLIASPSTDAPARWDFVDTRVSCSPLRPKDLEKVYTDGRVSVWRWSAPRTADQDYLRTESRVGHEGIQAALRELSQPWRDADPMRVECKVVGVDKRPDHFQTLVDFHSSGGVGGGRWQQNAKWTCRWRVGQDVSQPKLTAIQLNEFEEIRAHESGGIQFLDDTEAILGPARTCREQLGRGVDYWRNRLDQNFGIDVNGNQGMAIGDVNGDGLDDLYICQQGGLPNRLLVRNLDGTVRDASSESGADWMELTRSALLVDLDNDADQDLVICQGWYLLIMLNSGGGRFELTEQHRCRGDSYSLSAADYDQDADLDIFVCGRDADPADDDFVGILGSPVPYHDANNGAPNMLWQNDGQGRFREVTAEVGLDQNNRRFSYAAAWADYDNDGELDLYVANDFGRNNLYQNQHGHFRDVAASLGVEDISAGMSVAWGDYDRDGRFDLYVSNMFSSAGNRIAYQRQFRPTDSQGALAHFRRHAKGNSLFRNKTPASFEDVSHVNGVAMGRWAWGAKFVDLNNDSFEDLYVANGFITTDDTGDL